MKFHLTVKSSNLKTGPIPVVTSSNKTCPTACPFRKAECYAEQYPLKGHWNEVSNGNRGHDWPEFINALENTIQEGQLWRYGQAGDLPGIGNRLATGMLEQLVATNSKKGARGWCYTHKPLTSENERQAVKSANADGFTVNLSANSLEHADKLASMEIGPIAVVLPESQVKNTTTPQGRKVVVCPATIRDNVTCESCGLCAKANRSCIVGFPAHGMRKKALSEKVQN